MMKTEELNKGNYSFAGKIRKIGILPLEMTKYKYAFHIIEKQWNNRTFIIRLWSLIIPKHAEIICFYDH